MARTAHTVKQKEEIASRKSKRISARQKREDGNEGSDDSLCDDADLDPSEQTVDHDTNGYPTREAERTDAAIPLLALGKSILPAGVPQRIAPPSSVMNFLPGQSSQPTVALALPCPAVSNISATNGHHETTCHNHTNGTLAPSHGQHYPGHIALPQMGLPGHPSREQLLNMSLDELKELAAKRALSRPFVAENIRNKQKYIYPDHPHKVPCPARMMGPTHTYQNAFFVLPPSTPHASELRCSHRFCRQNRIKFLYCAYCKTAVTRMKFDVRHAHKDKRAGDDQEAASILASLVGESEQEQKQSSSANDTMDAML